jgi:hypothetical protein
MRIKAPASLAAAFIGPEGAYTLRFTPIDGEWDGILNVEIAGKPLQWSVERIDREEDGRLILSGMTATATIWGDSFWFEATVEPAPGQIIYWGKQVVWRTDPGA